MNIKVDGQSFNLLLIENVDQFDVNSSIIGHLIHGYLAKVKDKHSWEEIMNAMNIGIVHLFVCVGVKNGIGASILTAHPVDNDNKNSAMVNIGFLDHTVVNDDESKLIKKMSLSLLEKWAKDNNIKSLLMQTQHKETVFDKFLRPDGWKRVTSVYEKEISNGR
jgi:hypothetical protein